MSDRHITDWMALSETQRREAASRCQTIAARLQDRLSAFLQIAEPPGAAAAGPLSGLPYAAKDIFVAQDRIPTWGLSEPVSGLASNDTATVLDLLDGAGAARVGFTRMTALAYEPSGFNPLQGSPCNPWNADAVTGASSSGSAVAVASGAAFVALGSDTGGSLRIPAQGCGVTAWKPTWGLVPDAGAMPLAPGLDCIGLMARSARDIALVAPVIAPDMRDNGRTQVTCSVSVVADAMDRSEAAVRDACRQGLVGLSSAGATLIERDGMGLIDEAGNHALTVMQAEAAQSHAERLADPAFDTTLARRLGKGLSIGADTLADARGQQGSLLAAFLEEVLCGGTMIALPVMPIRTPMTCETDPGSADFNPRTLYDLSAFTRFANYLGLPAVAVPVAPDDRGLPVALQLVGAPHSDMALLHAAAALQSVTSWHGRLPHGLNGLDHILGDYLS